MVEQCGADPMAVSRSCSEVKSALTIVGSQWVDHLCDVRGSTEAMHRGTVSDDFLGGASERLLSTFTAPSRVGLERGE
jgi:hypothetical protein